MRLPAALLVTVLFSLGAAQAQTPPSASAPVTAEAFLADNLKKTGVKALPSGLQYEVVQAGPSGPSPRAGDTIKVHYEGALTNGAVFDSSIMRGKPAIMPLEDLVPGWMEALPLMRVGDEWLIYTPPSLGYGDRGVGPIPPNSALVFRIRLLGMLTAD
jgi:FKBP-type peptidyl-prolyl cis-trans isomerase FklB